MKITKNEANSMTDLIEMTRAELITLMRLSAGLIMEEATFDAIVAETNQHINGGLPEDGIAWWADALATGKPKTWEDWKASR